MTQQSLFTTGENCWRVENASRIAFLVDAAAYFDAFAKAAQRAERSLLILGWDFNSGAKLWQEDRPREWPQRLGDFLNWLVKRRRKLRIHILTWDFPAVYAVDRETTPIFGLPWHHHRRIHFRYDNHFPVGGCHHQKIVVVDDKVAFSGGLDLTCGRWDTGEHLAGDPRRTNDGKTYPPFHDLAMAVEGDAAKALGALARERWRAAFKKKLKAPTTKSDPWPEGLRADLENHRVAIARTQPAYDGVKEVREVEALYLDMIAAANRVIYIENQYFTSSKVGDALARRLAEERAPEIILVLRLASDGWLEGPTMGSLRTTLIKRLRAADRHQRLHCYYPTMPGLGNDCCCNVHSKLMIVDDEIARIGSANLNNRSMGFDTECDLTIEARGEPRASKAIRDFRNRLLGEHLAVAPQQVEKATAEEGSVVKAITKLQEGERTLANFDQLEEWPDAVVSLAEYTDLERPVNTDELIAQFAPDISIRERAPAFFKLGLVVLLMIGLFAAWRYTPLKEYATVEVVTSWAETFSTYPAAPLLVVVAYVVASIVFFPRTLLTLGTVLAFGPWTGFAYAMLGVLVAAFLTYYVGRLVSRDTVRRIAGEKINKITNTLRRKGLIAVVAVRMLPIAPFDIVNVVCGATRIKLWHFMVGTFIGMLPGMLAATVFGDQLKSAMGDGKINWWVVAVIALLFGASIFIARRYLFRGDPSQSPRPA